MEGNGARLRVAYTLCEYPSASETFIEREIGELGRQGVDVIPCALKAGAPGAEGSAARPGLYRGLITRWQQWTVGRLGPARDTERGAGMWAAACATAWARRLRGAGVQRVHSQFISESAAIGLVLAAQLRVPFSVSAHARDIFVERSPLLRHIMQAADFVAVCWEAGAEELRKHVPTATRRRIEVVYHGLPGARDARPLATPWPREGGPARRLAGVGRLVEKKGFGDLLIACSLLRKKGVEVELGLAGEGPLGRVLRQAAEELGVAEAVTFHGLVQPAEVGELFSGTDVLVVPSIVASDGDRDGIPNVILEAFAAGVPVVGTRTGGIPELNRDGEAVALCPSGDPEALASEVLAVLEEEGRAERLRAEGARVLQERFDVGTNVGRLAELMRRGVLR